MQRIRLSILLILAVSACSACSTKPPGSASGESPKPTAPAEPGVAQAAPAPSTPAPAALPPPDPREAALASAVLELFEGEHLLHKRLDDSISREAFKEYLDRIDGTKMFLLKADRDGLGKYADKIDDELRTGRLDLAHDGAKVYVQRVVEVEKWVSEMLAAPLNHNDEEWIELDPKKTEPATTEQELKERWRRRLELDVLERVAAMDARLEAEAKAKADKAKKPPKNGAAKDGAKDGSAKDDDEEEKSPLPAADIPPTPEGRDAKARADLAKSYAGRFARLKAPSQIEAAADLVNAVASTLDPHTTYLPPAEKANFDIHMTGSLEGIGAVLRERDHYIEVSELVPGGASWRQGKLQAGDLILAVAADGQDPVDVIDMHIDDVVKMIRGPKGTVVRLTIQKASGTKDTIAITRDVVVVEEAYARGAIIQHKSGASYGYIHLPSFYGGRGAKRTAAGDMHRLLTEIKAKKVAGVIIDIRGNGGGILGDAVEMTGQLVEKGPVVMVRDNRNHRETLSDDKGGTDFDGPVVLMVDRFSASASEIYAGALQDYGRAIVVGTGPTHGKGTVQTLADLDRSTGGKMDLGVLKITIQQFFRVSGASTQREGVSPDIVLPDPAGHVETGEASLDHAIAFSQIDPAPHDQWPGKWNKADLAKKSAARVSKQPVFGKISTLSQLLRTRRDDTRVPLAKSAWEARRKAQRAAIEAASPDLKNQPAAFTVKSIDDPVTPAVQPQPNGKADDRLARWRDNLARDPWVDESLNIITDVK